jgi:hypothetical protein
MPDREYIALKEQGQDIPIGVVSETQNAVTLWCSFGLIGASIFVAVLIVTALLGVRVNGKMRVQSTVH